MKIVIWCKQSRWNKGLPEKVAETGGFAVHTDAAERDGYYVRIPGELGTDPVASVYLGRDATRTLRAEGELLLPLFPGVELHLCETPYV